MDTHTELRFLLRSAGGTIFKMAAPMYSGRKKNFLKFQIVWTVMFVISFRFVQVNDFILSFAFDLSYTSTVFYSPARSPILSS